jgi:transposase-like protein
MTSEERRLRRFSEDFRKEQVRIIEAGEMTIGEVSRLYEVKRESVRKWLVKYGTKPVTQQFVLHTSSDVNRIKDLESQVKQLQELIGRLHVEMVYKNELIELAKETLGPDFEKKAKWRSL